MPAKSDTGSQVPTVGDHSPHSHCLEKLRWHLHRGGGAHSAALNWQSGQQVASSNHSNQRCPGSLPADKAHDEWEKLNRCGIRKQSPYLSFYQVKRDLGFMKVTGPCCWCPTADTFYHDHDVPVAICKSTFFGPSCLGMFIGIAAGFVIVFDTIQPKSSNLHTR